MPEGDVGSGQAGGGNSSKGLDIGASVQETVGQSFSAVGDPNSAFFKSVIGVAMMGAALDEVTPFLPTALAVGQGLGKAIGAEAEVYGKNGSPLLNVVNAELADLGINSNVTTFGISNVGPATTIASNSPSTKADPVAPTTTKAKFTGPGGM